MEACGAAIQQQASTAQPSLTLGHEVIGDVGTPFRAVHAIAGLQQLIDVGELHARIR